MADYLPQRPQFDSSAEIWTYQDAVEHLLDQFGNERVAGRDLRQAKRAVLAAARALPNKHLWSTYVRRYLFTTAASQTLSCAYDHTGGSSERLVTISGGAVDQSVRFFRITIAGVQYEIDQYQSATTFTLLADSNPGSDLAAGTSCTLFRPGYPLPADFRGAYQLFDVTGARDLGLADADHVHAQSVFSASPSSPNLAAVFNGGEYFGGQQIVFGPPPSTARSYSLLYARKPRTLLTELATATATTTGTTVTAGSSVFEDKHVGCVIRFSPSGTTPDGLVGGLSDTDTPFASQRIIQAVNSGTEAVIDTALPADIADKAVTISDPLDLDVGSMLTYFLRLAEAEYARILMREDRHERSQRADKVQLEAMAADDRNLRGIGGGAAVPFHLRPWSTISDEQVSASV